MVALPLFKLASLFLRHVSKYGANRIKVQAHDHPRFRVFAAKYGQSIHQLNMRLSVALLRDLEAEIRAKEKAEAPTVKTKEQIAKEEEIRAKHGTTSQESRAKKTLPLISVWRRKFRPLPEAKAVDLFADVVGDGFILLVGTVLILYEYHRSSQKPDANLERFKELDARFEELDKREKELEEAEKRQRSRVLILEEALRGFKDPKTQRPLLPPAPTTSPPT
ncbi:optic atrophy 3-like protein [Annulohypoxylon bovei var. microspora]|nr:optic atrophy 3-like protein [Annulohypoxylon bovei var. microspora]